MKLRHLGFYILAAALVIFISFSIAVSKGKKAERKIYALNTYITITVYGKDSENAASEAVKQINEAEALTSAYISSSEVSKLNNAEANTKISLSHELYKIIFSALNHYNLSDHRFDITVKPLTDLWNISNDPRVPSQEEIDSALTLVGSDKLFLDPDDKTITFLTGGIQLDLGGIAKGYAADRAAEAISKYDIDNAILNLGGNIIVYGKKSNSSPWTVGIQDPSDTANSSSCTNIQIDGEEEKYKTVVTSGAYERNFTDENGNFYHHILNPETGFPYNGEISGVSVIADCSMDADAISTSIYMMSIKDGLEYAEKLGVDTVIIGKDSKIYTTLPHDRIDILNKSYTLSE